MIERLVGIMATLRDPNHGCAWDRAQTFATIAPYTVEEAHEVADAIARADMVDLKDELGDLLLQIVFHSRIAEEAGAFDLHDVIDAICNKMERRHPHIFGDASGSIAPASPDWEQIKSEERAKKHSFREPPSALDGVALGLPALMRAEKLQKRAARTGFDWPDETGPRAKIDEEIAEVEQAFTDENRQEEFGDLLFSVVNWARHKGVDPETALRMANAKFEQRFRRMETLGGDAFYQMDLDTKEMLWQRVKTGAA